MTPTNPNDVLGSAPGATDATISGNALRDVPAHSRPDYADAGLMGCPLDDEDNEPSGDVI